MQKLNLKQRILVAGTLFGMFFGAGNLIFPVHLGQLAGKNVIPAMLGFIITAVTIPILGVAAIGNTHSDGLQSLANKIGKKYSYFFTCLLYLTIGPLFAIPRCATVSFTTGIEPIVKSNQSQIALLIFSLVFFAIVLLFSLKPSNITIWIGKIINPIFLLFLGVLLFVSLIHPGVSVFSTIPSDGYNTASKSFFSALVEGYGTMDAIAGLAFGIVVIDIIRRMGINDDSAIANDVLRSGLLTGIVMALIYLLTILMGTESLGLFKISDNGGIALAQISNHYLGKAGNIVLAITITFACLKTSIGLVTSCSETFTKMTKGKISYSIWAIIFTVFSFCVSNVGLSSIITYSIPVLMLLYPATISLIILALCGKLFNHDKSIYISVSVFTWIAAIFDFLKTLPANIQNSLHLETVIKAAQKYLPLFDINLGWVVPASIGLIIGIIIYIAKCKKAKT